VAGAPGRALHWAPVPAGSRTPAPMSWIDDLRFDDRGLIPVIAQEATAGEVLMLAYANREALERTIRTGRGHYWSRSRQELWRKGATSGNEQEVLDVRADCDADAVLYRVRQTGPACHTGHRSCFHRRVSREASLETVEEGTGDVLAAIEQVVRQRDERRPEGSYTTYLLEQGIDKVLKKMGEEATEVVIAAKNEDPAEIAAESADLLYHLLVMLRERGIPFGDVREELARRFGEAPTLPSERSRTEITDHSS